jgi:hypothetical protein
MKKTVKVLAGVACLAAISGASLGLTACGDTDKIYMGEYQYTEYGTNYGVKVAVEVKSNKIENVYIIESDYVQASTFYSGTWTQASHDNYYTNRQKLLDNYKGLSVDTVKGYTVAVNEKTPLTSDSADFNEYNKDLILTGATQSSGRLLLAVQNALNDGTEVKVGTYQYTEYGTNYGIMVAVEVKSNKIENVYVIESDYVQASTYYSGTWTAESNANYYNNRQTLLNNYKGLSVDTVKGYTVAVNEKTPLTSDSADFNVYNSDLILTGATQSSGRLLLAVQAALNS